MARKKQQLINYHTSKAIMPQAVDVQLGEIVVRHATDKPELLIKKDNNEFATFVDSGKVQSMITALSTDLQGQIDDISEDLSNNYATSASTVAAIEAVDTKLTTYYATSADTKAAIEAVDDKFAGYATSADTKAAISAVDTKLTTKYATSAATVAAIKAVNDKFADYATSAATVAAIKVVDDKFGGYATSADTEAAISAVQGNVDTLKNSVTGLSASTVSIETTANSAIQTASIVDGATCKVSVSKVNTELQFDFRNLVIDCGDF